MDLFKRKAAKAMPLSYYGDPVLRKTSEDIPEITDGIRELAEHMLVTMRENDGQGLAAPQVGHNINLVTLATAPPLADEPPATSPGEMSLIPRMPMILVNPKLTDFSQETDWACEGCLSLPDLSGEVERSIFVQLTFQTLEGTTESYRCGGMLSRCLQHEIDHLNGVLYIDRMREDELKEIDTELNKLKTRTERQLKSRLKKRRK